MPAKENPANENANDEAARKAYAESLRRQIENLKAGRSKKPATPSLRDFIDEKMAEDAEKLKKEPT
jgi:hypothetical protein